MISKVYWCIFKDLYDGVVKNFIGDVEGIINFEIVINLIMEYVFKINLF